MKDLISQRAKIIDASGIRKVFALAADLKDPVNLSIGQPDFDVPDPLKNEAINAIKQGYNKYSQTPGDPELVEKITQIVSAKTGWNKPGCFITSGVSGALLVTFMAMINPGDEVIIPDPYFVIYKHTINMLGGKCVFVDTYPDFKLDPQKIKDAITNKTKLIIINSPCNPTGVIYTDSQLKDVAEIAAKNDIPILSDEIYEKFCYDSQYTSITKYYPNVILMNGFSKAYAMLGWRLGYLAVPSHYKELMDNMLKVQQYTFVCAPTPLQRAAIAALDYDVTDHVNDYKIKRDIVYQGLKDKFEIVKPQGAFYAFVKAPNTTGTEFTKRAIANNCLIIPGNVFSEKDTHFRVCFTTTNEKLEKGVEILRSLA